MTVENLKKELNYNIVHIIESDDGLAINNKVFMFDFLIKNIASIKGMSKSDICYYIYKYYLGSNVKELIIIRMHTMGNFEFLKGRIPNITIE